MKSKIKTVFYCDYCKKKGLVKSKMKRHEELCSKNPVNARPCFNCEHLTKRQTSIYIDQPDYGSNGERRVDLFYCNATKCFLHTPQAIAKKNSFELEEANYPMPNACDSYEQTETPF